MHFATETASADHDLLVRAAWDCARDWFHQRPSDATDAEWSGPIPDADLEYAERVLGRALTDDESSEFGAAFACEYGRLAAEAA